ncbi:MAG: methyltransferase domain-containing protein [bacterium]
MLDASAAPRALALPSELVERLRCPACRASVVVREDRVECAGGCPPFPVRNGVPVLVDERDCVLTHEEILRSANAFNRPRSRAEVWAKRLVPSPSRNVTGARVRKRFMSLVGEGNRSPAILRVGNGEDAVTFDDLPASRVVSSDLFFYPGTNVVCDAHRIPFADETFDGVTGIAVLEHVADPARAVAEIHRVLRPRGVVLAETPFMQQVHGGAFDFTRFTDLGHRRLFRSFEEIERGACGGTGMSLAWAWHYFLLSLLGGRGKRRRPITAFAYLTSFWLRFFDRALIARRETLDGASGLYFLGRKGDRTLSDRELIGEYRGAIGS